jgi:parvulin-like peptidyl-prolyl isomerase
MTQGNVKDSANAGRNTGTGRKRAKILLGSLFVMAVCGVIRYCWNAPPANANPSERRETAPSRHAEEPREPQANSARSSESDEPSIPSIVATVNTQRITRDELGNQCVRHFGKEVLESMVNKRLIMLECRQRGIKVTRNEVNAEITQMAKRFKIPVDQWLKMLKEERNVTPEQYANDIIWPMIALRKIAGNKVTVSQQDIQREFETQFGEQVRVRLIATTSLDKAKNLRAKALADPDNFGNLAKKYSEDGPSAGVKGVINPIRKHGSYESIEKVVFKMRDGDISPVIEAGGQYVILKRESLIEAKAVDFEEEAPKLQAFLRDKQLRGVAQDLFKALQDKAVAQKAIQIVWSDPDARKQMPGVAAMVYDDEISMRDLADECLVRHGQEVLEGVISHKVVELECKKKGIAVTNQEIDEEISRLAAAGVRAKPDGSPDVKAWLDLIKKRGISVDVYRNDAIWTSLALKKLVGNKIRITDDDLQKGFEANYGERVRCKAIVLNDMRRAQQVFEMARKDNTSEKFGKLASHYSVEPGSQALDGDVPPIGRHGGQPDLEKEAFQLRPGELSGIIQVGDKCIILRCEGRTEPVRTTFAAVRGEIKANLYDKKLRMAMEERFDSLQESATIDNYLTGASHSPKQSVISTTSLPKLQEMQGR